MHSFRFYKKNPKHAQRAFSVGAAPRRPGKCREAANILLRQQQVYPPQAARIKFGLCDTAMRCADSRFAKPRISPFGGSFCFCKKNQKAAARTCKKLPVASFCASETAETGRIANGCEQGDHVSRRKGVKARAACCPDRGKLPACQEVPERERVYSFCFCKKNQKAAGTPSCDLGSKLYRGVLSIKSVAVRV